MKCVVYKSRGLKFSHDIIVQVLPASTDDAAMRRCHPNGRWHDRLIYKYIFYAISYLLVSKCPMICLLLIEKVF